MQRVADRVQFTDEAAGAYHARKHDHEIPTGERTADVVSGYYLGARRTVREGRVVRRERVEASRKLVFHLAAATAGAGKPITEAVVFLRPSGSVVLATYGQAKEGQTEVIIFKGDAQAAMRAALQDLELASQPGEEERLRDGAFNEAMLSLRREDTLADGAGNTGTEHPHARGCVGPRDAPSSLNDLQQEGRRRPRAMTAPARRDDAAKRSPAAHSMSADELWRAAVQIRQEWLGHGLSTQPADRATAERSLTAIYARISRPQPRFEWVDSPYKALPRIAGLPTHDQLYRWIRDPLPAGPPPLASDLAAMASRLRAALGEGVAHADPELSPARTGKNKQPWPELPPLRALASGVPLGVVMHQGVRGALRRSLAQGFYLPVRAALAAEGPVPVCWYGQQDASWVAYYDLLQRLGLARYKPDTAGHLDEWAALTRSCGWWWPGKDVCVVVERPATVRIEPVPGVRHEEIRIRPSGVEYRDGWRPLTR